MIKCLIIDLDGVVMPFQKLVLKQAKVTSKDLEPFFKGPFQRCLTGDTDCKKALETYLQWLWWQGHIEDIFRSWFASQSHLRPEVLDTIQQLRQHSMPCYLATNQEFHRAQYLQQQLQIGKYFNGLFFSCEMKSKKPDMKFYDHIYQHIQKKHQCERHEIMFRDDSQSYVDGAWAAGRVAYLYEWFDEFQRITEVVIKNI